MAQQAAYTGTGRRKDSVARVRLVPGTVRLLLTVKILINIFHSLT